MVVRIWLLLLKDVKFLINAKTFKPEFIDNLQIKPAEDDFNFEGGGVIAKAANHYLNKLTDPPDIGKTVQINFTDKDKIDHIKVSKDDFNKLKVKFDNSKNLTPNLDAYEKYFNNTIIKSGVIDYLDENNKLVMFGSNNSDSMVNTQATNMNFNEALYSGFVGIYNHYISMLAVKAQILLQAQNLMIYCIQMIILVLMTTHLTS